MPSSKSTTSPSTPSATSAKRRNSSIQESMKQGKLGFSTAKRTASADLTKGKPANSVKPTHSPSVISATNVVIDLSNDSESDDESIVFEPEDDEGRILAGVEPPTKKRQVQAPREAKAKAVFDAREGEENGVVHIAPAKRKSSTKEARDSAKVEVAEAPASIKEAVDEEKPHLNVKDRRWRTHFGEVRDKMGNLEPIHSEDKNMVDHILRVFDLTYKYGPCIGVTRLQRWERAYALGLSPPSEVKEILLTKEGSDDERYAQCVFHGEV